MSFIGFHISGLLQNRGVASTSYVPRVRVTPTEHFAETQLNHAASVKRMLPSFQQIENMFVDSFFPFSRWTKTSLNHFEQRLKLIMHKTRRTAIGSQTVSACSEAEVEFTWMRMCGVGKSNRKQIQTKVTRTHALTRTHTRALIHTLAHSHSHTHALAHTYTHTHTHTHTVHTRVRTHTGTDTHMHTHAHISTHMHAHAHANTHTHTHTHTHRCSTWERFDNWKR